MEFCKYCNDVLIILKNKHFEVETSTLSIEEFNDLLIQKYNADGEYYDDEIMYTVDFSERDVLSINTSVIKEMFPDKSDIEIISDAKTLFNELIKVSDTKSRFHLQCNTCTKTYHLKPNSMIDSVNLVTKVVCTIEDPHIRYEDPTLFVTKNYICTNDQCPSTTDTTEKMQKEREAKFYKPDATSNSVQYICGVCKARWKT